MPPRFILAATIAQMEQFISTPAARNPFVSAFNDRMAAACGIAPATREGLRAQAEADHRVAGLSRVAAGAGGAAFDAGPGDRRGRPVALEGGAEAYAFFLRAYTSTTTRPTRFMPSGCARSRDSKVRSTRSPGGSERTEGRSARASRSSRRIWRIRPTEAGRTAIMADIDAMIPDAGERSKPLFDKTPRAAVEARPFPEFRESNAAASYTSPARDGSRPGTFQIPLRPSRT